jgi:hypothetical protein
MAVESIMSPEMHRYKARIKLMNAIYKSRPLLPVFDHYIANEDSIVSSSVRRHAERVGRCPGAEVRNEAITLYERDKAIARRFQEGVTIKGRKGKAGRKVGLPGLIRREQKAMKHTGN